MIAALSGQSAKSTPRNRWRSGTSYAPHVAKTANLLSEHHIMPNPDALRQLPDIAQIPRLMLEAGLEVSHDGYARGDLALRCVIF